MSYFIYKFKILTVYSNYIHIYTQMLSTAFRLRGPKWIASVNQANLTSKSITPTLWRLKQTYCSEIKSCLNKDWYMFTRSVQGKHTGAVGEAAYNFSDEWQRRREEERRSKGKLIARRLQSTLPPPLPVPKSAVVWRRLRSYVCTAQETLTKTHRPQISHSITLPPSSNSTPKTKKTTFPKQNNCTRNINN
jgi:hypothetical protein